MHSTNVAGWKWKEAVLEVFRSRVFLRHLCSEDLPFSKLKGKLSATVLLGIFLEGSLPYDQLPTRVGSSLIEQAACLASLTLPHESVPPGCGLSFPCFRFMGLIKVVAPHSKVKIAS